MTDGYMPAQTTVSVTPAQIGEHPYSSAKQIISTDIYGRPTEYISNTGERVIVQQPISAPAGSERSTPIIEPERIQQAERGQIDVLGSQTEHIIATQAKPVVQTVEPPAERTPMLPYTAGVSIKGLPVQPRVSEEFQKTWAGKTPAMPGSIAAQHQLVPETTRIRESLYTYKPTQRLIEVSERLQAGVERAIGYTDQSSIPVKAGVGFASAFTGLPAFAGQTAFSIEALIRYPSASLRGIPTGFKIMSSQIYEQARTKPVEFGGSIVGLAVGSKAISKVPIPKITSEGIKAFSVSEEATLGRRGSVWDKIPTMRESAISKGEQLTRKVEFGKTFKEPTISSGAIPIASGKQVLVQLQEAPAIPKLRPVAELERPVVLKGLEKGLFTQAELKTQAVPKITSKTILYTKTELQTLAQPKTLAITETKVIPMTSLRVIPYAQQITQTVTKVKPISLTALQLQTRQLTKQVPITKQMTQLKTMQATKTLLKTSPMLKTQLQTSIIPKTVTQLRTELKTQALTRTQTKTLTDLMTRTRTRRSLMSSQIGRLSRTGMMGGRKYYTALGGKTYKQLTRGLK